MLSGYYFSFPIFLFVVWLAASSRGSFSFSMAFLVFAALWLFLFPRVDSPAAGIFLALSLALSLIGGSLFAAFSGTTDRDEKEKEKADSLRDAEWEFARIVQPLMELPAVEKLSFYRHHRAVSRLEHCLDVAWLSYTIARRFSLDRTATVRGALLHDLFFYDSTAEGPLLHMFHHPAISLKNARTITVLTGKEEDIIKKHMWPLTLVPPRYPEAWIVCFADICCSIKDLIIQSKNLRERFLSL